MTLPFAMTHLPLHILRSVFGFQVGHSGRTGHRLCTWHAGLVANDVVVIQACSLMLRDIISTDSGDFALSVSSCGTHCLVSLLNTAAAWHAWLCKHCASLHSLLCFLILSMVLFMLLCCRLHVLGVLGLLAVLRFRCFRVVPFAVVHTCSGTRVKSSVLSH